jgi:hypothetical protein
LVAGARYDQYGNLVVDEERDYLGALVAVRRADTMGRDVPTPPEELALLQIQEEEIFDQVGGLMAIGHFVVWCVGDIKRCPCHLPRPHNNARPYEGASVVEYGPDTPDSEEFQADSHPNLRFLGKNPGLCSTEAFSSSLN